MNAPTTDALPSEVRERIDAELARGERLLWAGQPRPDLCARRAYFLVPFGVIFGGFALSWMTGAGSMTGGWMAPCGLPFVAIGAFLVASPVWLRGRAKKTVYALTDRRAIIWEPAGMFGGAAVRNYTAAGLGRMSRTERGDGSGSLVFEEVVTHHGHGSDSRSHTHERGFLHVDRVREVEDAVRRALLGGQ